MCMVMIVYVFYGKIDVMFYMWMVMIGLCINCIYVDGY